jgi:hypothetical protein
MGTGTQTGGRARRARADLLRRFLAGGTTARPEKLDACANREDDDANGDQAPAPPGQPDATGLPN